MGSLNITTDIVQELKTREGFYQWFIEIEEKLFEDFSIEEFVDEDNGEDLPLGQKQRIESVKKYMEHFSESDISLELAEDARNNTSFVATNNPLEGFTILGAIAFFDSYVLRKTATANSLKSVITFLEKCKAVQNVKQAYVDGMEAVLDSLKFYCQLSDIPPKIGGVDGKPSEGSNNAIVLGLKLHFLQSFPNPIVPTIRQLLDSILLLNTNDAEWNLQQYYMHKLSRLHNSQGCRKPKLSELENEKIALEAASQKSSALGPRLLLAKCQFLCDFLISGEPDLEFTGLKFNTHSEIIQFIRCSSETITKDYPSFLRANFVFSEMFATELPITRQDRQLAKSFLMKSLEANPTSSKIHHKIGMFLIKGRQFIEAANYFQRATELDPHSAHAYHSLLKLLLRDPIANKERLESFFSIAFPEVTEFLGPENELSFWKGCYFFKTGEIEPAINVWTETILEFYITKPELDLETVLPFKTLPEISKKFLWLNPSNLTLEEIATAVKDISSQEKTRRRVVFLRLQDLVRDAMKK